MFFFFFQAEDGIRDVAVTGVQTCALPIWSIKAMMNEIMQIVAEKDTITKEVNSADIDKRFKDIEKIVLPFLYNLGKTDEPYIHWPNRGPIIKAQIEKLLKLTRGK